MSSPTVLGYMRDQPRALRATFERRSEFLEPFSEFIRMHKVRKVLFFGSGTSYNASLVAAYYFKHIAGIAAEAHYPTVFLNYEKADWLGTLAADEVLCFGISQSGTSISTVDVMEYARAQGHLTLALTEDLESEITRYVDAAVHLLCGKELTPPETRGYTVTLLQMYLFAWTAAFETGACTQEAYDVALAEAEALCGNFGTVMDESESWYKRNATRLVNSERIYVLGYGIDYGSALEGMLKIGEMLRVPALGYEIEEYSHGPTMALNPKQSIIMFGSDEPEWERCLQFREAFRQYSPRVFLITCKDIEADERGLVFSVKTSKYLAPIAFTVPAQFVAANGASDIDVDTGTNPFEIELSHISDKH